MVNSLPKRQKAVGSHIVFCEKCDGHRNLVKFKAYIVVKGFL